MQHHKAVLAALACFALGGCAPDNVLFVTDSSIGINVESKPATVSLAYDRTEGFFGPRYDSGAIPPVVASLQTGGTVFNPAIRQFYATGNAALIAARAGAPGQPAASIPPGGRKMAFFGTTTTLGFKVGFDGVANYPDSFVFGYRRREFSFIPVGETGEGSNAADTYASTLASIDSNTTTAPVPGVTVAGSNNVGLTSSQFFATGGAADLLAANPVVARALAISAENAAAATLSPEDKKALVDQMAGLPVTQTANVTIVQNWLPDDATYAAKRDALLKAAGLSSGGVDMAALKDADKATFIKYIGSAQKMGLAQRLATATTTA